MYYCEEFTELIGTIAIPGKYHNYNSGKNS